MMELMIVAISDRGHGGLIVYMVVLRENTFF
jgi:hypothetical protein